MKIRNTTEEDIGRLSQIYAVARRFMAENGNPTQWPDTYPGEEMLMRDVSLKRGYAVEDDEGRICGTFVFFIGDDPTYSYIEDGSWRYGGSYGVIHRIASDGTVRGMLKEALAFAFSKTDHVRIDTHVDNAPMRHLLEKEGFTYCGIIYTDNGSKRLAFEKMKNG